MGREKAPNELFRAARERLPSPSGAPRPMSRRELADVVNTYLWREHKVAEKLNQDHIGRIERGRTRWPSHWRRTGFRAVLGVATDTELGFYFYRQGNSGPADANPSDEDEHGQSATSQAAKPVPYGRGPVALGLHSDVEVVKTLADPDECDWMNRDADDSLQVGVEAVVYVAARESWEHLAVSGRGVDDAGIEHVQGQVRRLAHRYHEVAPIRLLAEVRHARNLAYRLLERTRRPGQMADLYLIAGQACGLLAMTSFDLAQWDAAADQIRAAKMYADLIDHAGLRTWAAGTGALIAYWTGQPRQAVAVLDAAAAAAPPGVASARLGGIRARAWSYLGNAGEVLVALEEADRAMDAADGNDEFYDGVGGELGWGRSLHHACAGTALLHAGHPDAAVHRIRTALQTAPDDPHGGLVPLRAHVDLAAAELAAGRLDAALDALAEVWCTPAQWRRHGMTARLEQVGHTLAGPGWRGYRPAAELRDRIEVFVAEAIATRALPAA